MKPLKLVAAAIASVALAMSLTACGPVIKFPFDDPKATFDSPSGYGYGLSGEELPDFTTVSLDNIDTDDSFMMTACQHMEAFETGVIRNFSGDVPLTKGESKDDYRTMVLDFLEYLNDDYPETIAYYSGALAHLTKPDKQVENYDTFQKACLPYLALVTRSIDEYLEPVSLDPPSCWTSGDPSNIRVALEIQDAEGGWTEVGTTTLATDSGCSSDYPYSAQAIDYWPYDYSTTYRWHYTLKDGRTFNDGTYDAYDDETTIDRYGLTE